MLHFAQRALPPLLLPGSTVLLHQGGAQPPTACLTLSVLDSGVSLTLCRWRCCRLYLDCPQERCTEVMYSHRKNDVFAVLDFGLRFRLPRLQGSCLAHLSQVSRGRLVDKAERIIKVSSTPLVVSTVLQPCLLSTAFLRAVVPGPHLLVLSPPLPDMHFRIRLLCCSCWSCLMR